MKWIGRSWVQLSMQVKCVAVPQMENRPELRSLKEVQRSQREFDSQLWQRSKGKNPSHAISGSGRQNACMQI